MEIIKKRRVSLSSLSAGNMPAGLESDPRTERKPELFQKDRDRAKNESFAIGLAGRKSHLLPKIGDARKKLFHQAFHRWWSKLPLSSLFQSIFHLCFPLRSKASYCFPHHWGLRTGPRKANYWACSLFLLIPLFESIPHFSSYPSAFSCAGQPSEALFELPSDIACCERSRNGFTGPVQLVLSLWLRLWFTWD